MSANPTSPGADGGGPRWLRVTGDDFGASAEANAAIVECAERGVLTHASAMVGAPAFGDAIERARALPRLAIGLHLVVCDGRPSAPAAQIPDLVDERGCFPADSTLVGLRLWRRRRRARPQLEREIRAQLDAFLAAGLPLSHVDGHHHLHQHPVVFGALCRVLTDYAVPHLRLMHEDRIARRGGGFSLLGEAIPAIHSSLARWHRRRAAQRRPGEAAVPIAPDERVYGLRASGRVDEAYLLWLIPRLCAPQVEIYSHPGRGPRGRDERDALCSPRVRDAIEAAGYTLAREARRTR